MKRRKVSQDLMHFLILKPANVYVYLRMDYSVWIGPCMPCPNKGLNWRPSIRWTVEPPPFQHPG